MTAAAAGRHSSLSSVGVAATDRAQVLEQMKAQAQAGQQAQPLRESPQPMAPPISQAQPRPQLAHVPEAQTRYSLSDGPVTGLPTSPPLSSHSVHGSAHGHGHGRAAGRPPGRRHGSGEHVNPPASGAPPHASPPAGPSPAPSHPASPALPLPNGNGNGGAPAPRPTGGATTFAEDHLYSRFHARDGIQVGLEGGFGVDCGPDFVSRVRASHSHGA
jgi:hypothetical protein